MAELFARITASAVRRARWVLAVALLLAVAAAVGATRIPTDAGLARALVLDPEIILVDEPDSGLDPVRTALLCELIREVHAENGGCYLVISHDLGTARRIADFIAVLWSGKIVESGPKEEVFDSSNPFVNQFLHADVTGPLSMD